MDNAGGHKITKFLRVLSDSALVYIFERETKIRLPLILNSSSQYKEMLEYEGIKRTEEQQLFHLSSDTPFNKVNEEILKINIRACKVQICAQYFKFQAKLAAIIKEQEKWKEVAKRITEEFQKTRKQREVLKSKGSISNTTNELLNNTLEREAQAKALREITQFEMNPVVKEAKDTKIVDKVQVVINKDKKRNKLMIETENKYADIADIINKASTIMKHTVTVNRDPKVKELARLKDSLGKYLKELKAQRNILRALL